MSKALEQLREAESLNLPDSVVPLRALIWTSEGLVVVPGFGEACPSEWAQKQLSGILGLHFNRSFEGADSIDHAEEMTRRLRRAKGNVRLRLSKGQKVPTIRAVVSPGYTAIEDTDVLGVLGDTLRGTDAHVHRLDVTKRVTSVLIGVGQPQHIGGMVGLVWGCLNVTNSNVGWAGLSVTLCSNGMRAPTVNAQILRARHRAIDIDEIRGQLVEGMRSLPENLTQANRILEASSQWPVVNVEAEARELLRERGIIRNHLAGVLSAFRREPHRSVFGLSQAMTLHAQQVTPEDRIALETLAGSYVLRSAP